MTFLLSIILKFFIAMKLVLTPIWNSWKIIFVLPWRLWTSYFRQCFLLVLFLYHWQWFLSNVLAFFYLENHCQQNRLDNTNLIFHLPLGNFAKLHKLLFLIQYQFVLRLVFEKFEILRSKSWRYSQLLFLFLI